MQLDFPIEDLIHLIKQNQQTILALHTSGLNQREAYESLKSEKELIQSQLTWKEKYLFGLSGNTDRIKRVEAIRGKLNQINNALKEVDRKINSETKTLDTRIVNYLITNSDHFNTLNFEWRQSEELLSNGIAYYNYLINARNSIKDALIFKSWDSLLNHPQAQREIDKFITYTSTFQEQIIAYENALKVNLMNNENLEEFIQFSSEEIALESFNKLSGRTEEIIKVTREKSSKKQKEINSMIHSLKEYCLKINQKK